MPWFWTDDLARLLVESGQVSGGQVQDWVQTPVAMAAPEGSDPLEFALALAGLESSQVA